MLLGRSLKLLDLTLGCAVQHQQTTTQQATEMQVSRSLLLARSRLGMLWYGWISDKVDAVHEAIVT